MPHLSPSATPMPPRRLASLLLALLVVVALPACQRAYFGALESIGIEKRKVLADRVDGAQRSQEDAEEAYVDALEQFRSVVDFDGGNVERLYRKLDAELANATGRAETLRDRIDSVETVADALFREWSEELDDYKDAGLRAQSKRQLDDTRRRYGQLLAAMRRAEASFEPALAALNDQVLFLKHNLNAAAIGSIRDELPRLEQDAERLRADIERASREAESFLAELRREG